MFNKLSIIAERLTSAMILIVLGVGISVYLTYPDRGGVTSQPKTAIPNVAPNVTPYKTPVNIAPKAPRTLPSVSETKTTPKPVPKARLIAFSATWCGPCQRAKPSVNRIEAAGFVVTRYDIDTENGKAASNKYGVNAVPTFVIVEPNGTERPGTHDINVVTDYFNTQLPDGKKLSTDGTTDE